MTSPAVNDFAISRPSDRNAFLAFLGVVWLGILTGFGFDSFRHVSVFGLDYPLIVHIHAVVFTGWLVLFSAQVLLIRSGRAALHRRIGVLGAVFSVSIIILGPVTAIMVHAQRYAAAAPGTPPEFLAIQFGGILGFGVLTAAALLLRKDPAAHKRLMLLALFYLSDAGFARFLNFIVAIPVPAGPVKEFVMVYFLTDLLVVGLGLYDLVSRRRLHPAYVTGAIFVLALQLTELSLVHSDAWKTFALGLIGF